MKKRHSYFCPFLLFPFSLFAIPLSLSFAQGVLPPKSQPTTETKPAAPYVLIGETVPKTLTVMDANGKLRPLLSYKTANDILVLGFYSPRCAANQQLWPFLRRLHEAYEDWHVALVGVSVNSDETLQELADAMRSADLQGPVVHDENQQAARKLHATMTPEMIILDEWGQLRYRGPATEEVRKAIDAMVGHVEKMPNPEPGDLTGCPIQ